MVFRKCVFNSGLKFQNVLKKHIVSVQAMFLGLKMTPLATQWSDITVNAADINLECIAL